jgi:hypothetical protein
MAKRDKNRSYMDWEYEWEENTREEENRKNREKERRAKKLQSHKYTTDDWDDVE